MSVRFDLKNYAEDLERCRELCSLAKEQDRSGEDLSFYATAKDLKRLIRGPLKLISEQANVIKEDQFNEALIEIGFFGLLAKAEKRLERAREKISLDVAE